MMNRKNISEREYYLDWLRVFVVILIVPFHVAVSFSYIGSSYIYSENIDVSFFFVFISDFFNLWFMRILFLISGISTFIALKKRTVINYIIERFKRLLLPVIFMLISLNPISAYILAVNHYNFVGSFISFYPQFFLNPKKYLFWGHMWFCVYLLTFSIICIPLFNFLSKRKRIIHHINTSLLKRNNILKPMIIVVLFEIAFRPFYPGFKSLIGDWANFFVHLTFFILGYIISQSSTLINKISRKNKLFLVLGLVSSFMYIYLKRFSGLQIDQYIIQVILSMLWGVAAYTWVMYFMGTSRLFLNKSNQLLIYLSSNSFSLYMFHYLIITIINYFVLKTSLNNYFIWAISTISTYIVFVLIFELFIRRTKFLKTICGVK